ncbi:MAG: hypothetical protein IJ598_12785 [Ruminococcus sp.]|nr:hypothetical protein [Ruminococcus sp.]
MLKALRILGLILSTIGLIGVGAGFLASSAMIVAIGVRGVSLISALSYLTLGVGIASLAGGTVPLAVRAVRSQNDRKRLEDTREADRKQFSDYARDSLNPAKTRARLEQLRRNNPNLSGLVEHCLEQMDRIDTYQSRHKSLLDANEAIYLEDTIEIIDESEKRICRNIRNIINCCILIEDGSGSLGDLDSDIINTSFNENEEELKTVSTLLRYSVAYINNYNRNGVSDRRELDAWIQVMKASMGGNHEKNR